MSHKTTKFEKRTRKEILLEVDPLYLEKSKMSICQYCEHNLGFGDEFYECQIANEDMYFEVDYKREGVFYTQIIKCQMFVNKNKSICHKCKSCLGAVNDNYRCKISEEGDILLVKVDEKRQITVCDGYAD